MKVPQYIVCSLVIALAATGAAQADLTPADWAGVRVERPASGPNPVGINDTARDTPLIALPVSLDPLPSPPIHAGAAHHARPAAKQLPPAPDSSALFLCALGSLGTWQLGRSARKWNFEAVPDWYHTGGPTQIGHATPLDINSFTLERCALAAPVRVDELSAPVRREEYDDHRPRSDQFRSIQEGPRAPPARRR